MTTPPRNDPPRAYFLPRRVRHDGEETTLQKALRRGADPRDLEVEDERGAFVPYIVPRTPAEPGAPLTRR